MVVRGVEPSSEVRIGEIIEVCLCLEDWKWKTSCIRISIAVDCVSPIIEADDECFQIVASLRKIAAVRFILAVA